MENTKSESPKTESKTPKLPEWLERGIEETNRLKTEGLSMTIRSAEKSKQLTSQPKKLKIDPENLPHVPPFPGELSAGWKPTLPEPKKKP